MYKVLNTNLHPKISFNIINIEKQERNYIINGKLTLNGITTDITSFANIEEYRKEIRIKGLFSIKLTQFSMEPPTMLFLTVRDQIDITYNLSYKKDNK